MRKLILFILILVSVQVFGQNPTNYMYRATRERVISSMVDSMFRVPRYNGTPSGVRVSETSAIDGAIAMDTTNSRLYIFSGGAWIRLAAYSELSSASPAGNYGNVQINRNGVFSTPATDTLGYTTVGGFVVKNMGTFNTSGTGVVTSLIAKANPGGTGSTNLNSITFENTYGAGNYKNQFSLKGNSAERWAIGNDLSGNAGDNFYIYNAATVKTPIYVVTDKVTIGGGLGDAPDSTLDVRGGIKGTRGVRFTDLPTFADTTNYKPIVANSSGTLYKTTYWPSTTTVTTPTLQQVFATQSNTAVMTGDNEIAGGGHDFTISNTRVTQIDAVSGATTNSLIINSLVAGFQAVNASSSSTIAVGPTGVTLEPDRGNLIIDTLNGGAFTDSFLVRTESSGVVKKVDGAKVVSTTGTQTLTNKRWTPRVGSTTSSATPTINTDNVDIYKLTAQSAAITSFTSNLSGSPSDGDVLEIQITDDGTARGITWGTSFVSSSVTLPTTTTISTTLTVIFQYYTTSSYGNNKWVIANYY